jgi:Family of unknown function (DUF6247)
MTTPTVHGVERTGTAIRAALAPSDPDGAARFEAQLRAALADAATSLDLSEVEAVLTRWHAIAVMLVNPLTPGERDQLTRARAGDAHGLRERDPHGVWTTR